MEPYSSTTDYFLVKSMFSMFIQCKFFVPFNWLYDADGETNSPKALDVFC